MVMHIRPPQTPPRPGAALDRPIDWQITRKRGPLKKLTAGPEKETLKASEKAKAAVRAFVEHPFHIVKNLFQHRKVRYRGLAKNGHQLHTRFGLANLVIGTRQPRRGGEKLRSHRNRLGTDL